MPDTTEGCKIVLAFNWDMLLMLRLSREYQRRKYHCTIDLLFHWFGISCMTTDNFCFHLQNRLIQTSQTGGQQYSDTYPFSIPWFINFKIMGLYDPVNMHSLFCFINFIWDTKCVRLPQYLYFIIILSGHLRYSWTDSYLLA